MKKLFGLVLVIPTFAVVLALVVLVVFKDAVDIVVHEFAEVGVCLTEFVQKLIGRDEAEEV